MLLFNHCTRFPREISCISFSLIVVSGISLRATISVSDHIILKRRQTAQKTYRHVFHQGSFSFFWGRTPPIHAMCDVYSGVYYVCLCLKTEGHFRGHHDTIFGRIVAIVGKPAQPIDPMPLEFGDPIFVDIEARRKRQVFTPCQGPGQSL